MDRVKRIMVVYPDGARSEDGPVEVRLVPRHEKLPM